jgi:hypothetical protein
LGVARSQRQELTAIKNSTNGVGNTSTSWRQLTNDVALISFPWRTLGIDFKRTVTLDVFKLEGVRMNEHAFYHRQSGTLIVADLFFSFPKDVQGWPRFFVRHFMRLPGLFGISVLFRRFVIHDKEAFKRSLKALLALDFERLVVAHSEPIEKDAKRVVEQAVSDSKFLC